MPSQSSVTMTRVSRAVAKRLAGAPRTLKFTGRDRRIRAVDVLLTEAMDRVGVPQEFVPVKVEQLGARGLANALNQPPYFVAKMREAGYRFRYGKMTTLDHAQEWLAAHPDFLSSVATAAN